MNPLILIGISTLLLILGCYLALVILTAHKIIYNRKHKRVPFFDLDIATDVLNLEEITLSNALGQTLYAWFKVNSDSAIGDHILILQHGYKSNRSEMLQQAQLFYQAGFSILLTTLRAHDLADGEIISFALDEVDDIHLWHTYLTQKKGFATRKIGFVGNSMGGATLLHAHARYGDGAVLILQSVFAEMEQTIEAGVSYFTGLPGKLFGPTIARFIKHKTGIDSHIIQPRKWAEKVAIPIFIMQGGADKAIPTTSGQDLFNAVQTPPTQKEYWFEATQGHVQFEIHHLATFKKRIIPFLLKFLVKSQD